jgi:cytidylate kinase
MIIAIDGPAASGKSTVAKALAERLGFGYLDTGAMYRAIAYRALEAGANVDDEEAVSQIARSERIRFEDDPSTGLRTRVFVDAEDVTRAIRTPAVDHAVSPVARLPKVREAMVAQQRELGASGDVVVEGRDIGTVVFPNAEVKVFLTASADERARRREIDLVGTGHVVARDAVRDALERRDTIDSTRESSPLAIADDAQIVDTTGMSIDEVVGRISDLVESARSTRRGQT